MDAKQATDIIEMIAGRFPHYTITKATVAAFVVDVGDLPGDQVAAAVNSLARTQEDWPRAAQIRRHIATARGILPPDPDTAWSRINGSTWVTGDWPEADQIIYSLGGQQHLRQNPKDSRWAFTKTYQPAWEQAVAVILAADDLTPPAAIAARSERRPDGPAAEARRRLAERQAAAR